MTTVIIAVLMPGDMGHAVGRVLADAGYDVVTCLAGRSERTRALAETGGLSDLDSLDAVAAKASLVLSILPPAVALGLAGDMAAAMERSGARPVYVDCNAISPATARDIAQVIEAAGAPFIDAGIIGTKPGSGSGPRFYVSGADTGPMESLGESLDGKGFQVVGLGSDPGRASALKMCYAGLTKGTWTLHTAVLLAALRHPVLLAQTCATVDVISEGRLVIAAGVMAAKPPVPASAAHHDEELPCGTDGTSNSINTSS